MQTRTFYGEAIGEPSVLHGTTKRHRARERVRRAIESYRGALALGSKLSTPDAFDDVPTRPYAPNLEITKEIHVPALRPNQYTAAEMPREEMISRVNGISGPGTIIGTFKTSARKGDMAVVEIPFGNLVTYKKGRRDMRAALFDKILMFILCVMILIGFIITCTGCVPATSTVAQSVTSGSMNVRDFGAVGDGVTDDRAAIQAALSSGAADVLIPDGTYLVGTAPAQWWALHVPSGVRLHGGSRDGAVLLQAAPAVNAARILYADGVDTSISTLTLDGNGALQTADEHRAGIFGSGLNLHVSDVVGRNFTGDAFVVYGASHSRWTRVQAFDNARNGLTIDLTVDDVTIEDSVFRGNAVQQIDSEPANPSVETHVRLVNNVIDGGSSGNGYALTVVGASMTIPSTDWQVTGNTITGGVQVAWIANVTIAGNTITSGGNRAPITVLRYAGNVMISNNTLLYNGATDWIGGIYATGTLTAGQQPTGLVIAGNVITNLHAAGYGIRLDGISDAFVVQNTISGPGTVKAFSAGIRMRATNASTDFLRATIADNVIRDFGDAAIRVDGTSGIIARLDALDLQRNTYVNFLGTAMTRGAVLDDGTHALQRLYSRDNVSMSGVTVPMVGAPANSDYGTP